MRTKVRIFFVQYDIQVVLYYNCSPVNVSNSMNIKLFEWYKPHSLHDSPERG